jgi:hypothetical protein
MVHSLMGGGSGIYVLNLGTESMDIVGCSEDYTISKLKDAIEYYAGVPIAHQRLYHLDEELTDEGNVSNESRQFMLTSITDLTIMSYGMKTLGPVSKQF